MNGVAEATAEGAALTGLEAIGWWIAHAPDLSPGGNTLTLSLSRRERENYGEVALSQRSRGAFLPKLIYRRVAGGGYGTVFERERMMKRAPVTHVGFSDESNWNKGRFRSLGLVTCPLSSLKELEAELRDLLIGSGVSEFKWHNLGGARERSAAEKMCQFAVERALRKELRVDVLIWDIQDSRHNVQGRDDVANLQRMYYHLFRNVLRARWPNDAVWRLHPDEHTALNWKTVQDCLESVAERVEVTPPDLIEHRFSLRLRREFGLEEIRPVSSRDHPLLQLADLFAGMAVFSRDKFQEYQRWLSTAEGRLPLVTDSEDRSKATRSMRERFQVLREFDSLCKKNKMGVSLKRSQGLRTRNPNYALNFWIYEPQHPEDKAPRRVKK